MYCLVLVLVYNLILPSHLYHDRAIVFCCQTQTCTEMRSLGGFMLNWVLLLVRLLEQGNK